MVGGADIEAGVQGGPCGKFRNSCGSMCVGLVMLPISLYMVGWNENNYVCEQKRIMFASSKAKDVPCDSSGLNDDFVFFSCPLDKASFRVFTAEDFLESSSKFYQDNEKALHNVRFSSVSGQMVAELRQCQKSCSESTEIVHGQNQKVTKCTYAMQWATEVLPVISNPSANARQSCPGVELYQGLQGIPDGLLGSHGEYAEQVKTAVKHSAEPFVLNHGLVGQLPPTRKAASDVLVPAVSAAAGGPPASSCAQDSPPVGCMRLRFAKNDAEAVSVFTHVKGSGETTTQDTPSSWGCPGKPWQALTEGSVSKDEAIANLNAANGAMVVLLRIVFCVLAWVSVYCILSPLSAMAETFGGIANMIPCVGGYLENFIEGVVDSVLCCISCSVGLSCALFAMGVVWIVMRPLWGIALLLACAVICACGYAVRKQAGAPKSRRAREVAPMSAQAMSQPMMGQLGFVAPQMAAQPAAVAPAVAVPQPTLMQVTCPENLGPGAPLVVQAPDGRQLQVTVPAGVGPGMHFQVQV